MYELFRQPATRFRGRFHFPETDFLRRQYTAQKEQVKTHYRRFPKRVDSDNHFGRLLVHIPLRWDLDDRNYIRFVEDMHVGVSRAYGFTSPIHRGRVHEDGVTLGRNTSEIVLVSDEGFELPEGDGWRDLSPLRYLYHTRVDLGFPIPNNHDTVRGHAVVTANIPMLAYQYRCWLKEQQERFRDVADGQTESVFRFMGSYPLVNLIDSYFDIAVFNRLTKLSKGHGLPKLPVPHPFYLTDYSQRVDRYCQKIIETQANRSGDLEQVVYTTPLILKESLYEVMYLPGDPVTRHNEWALQVARLPYVRYLVELAVTRFKGDRRFTNQIYSSLIDASYDRIFQGVGSSEMVTHFQRSVQELLDLLQELGLGWR